MINTDTKNRYIDAIKDIRAVLLGPCPVNAVGILANEGVPTYLRRWTLSGNFTRDDIRSDFQCILNGLDRLINAYPGEPWLRVMRGRALDALGWHGRAIDDFEHATMAGIEHCNLLLFLAEACLHQAKVTMNDPLSYYMTAAIHSSKAITLNTACVRAYLCRAQCDAHIMKLCEYHRHTLPFMKKYQDIESDLRTARQISDETGQAEVSRIAENIKVILGVEGEED